MSVRPRLYHCPVYLSLVLPLRYTYPSPEDNSCLAWTTNSVVYVYMESGYHIIIGPDCTLNTGYYLQKRNLKNMWVLWLFHL